MIHSEPVETAKQDPVSLYMFTPRAWDIYAGMSGDERARCWDNLPIDELELDTCPLIHPWMLRIYAPPTKTRDRTMVELNQATANIIEKELFNVSYFDEKCTITVNQWWGHGDLVYCGHRYPFRLNLELIENVGAFLERMKCSDSESTTLRDLAQRIIKKIPFSCCVDDLPQELCKTLNTIKFMVAQKEVEKKELLAALGFKN